MDKKVIIISGMPASGKDTITRKLCELNPTFVAFKKHRSIRKLDKKKTSYFNISTSEFEKKIANGEFLQYHQRYERYYGISEDVFNGYLEDGKIPIIHIGRIDNLLRLKSGLKHYQEKSGINVSLIHVLLWETIDELTKRINKRDKDDEEIAKRISAVRQEYDDLLKLMQSNIKPFNLVIKNTRIEETCQLIQGYVFKGGSETDGYEEFKSYLKKYAKSLKEVDIRDLSHLVGETDKAIDWSEKIIPGSLTGLRIHGVVTLKNSKTYEKALNVDHCFFDYLNIKDEDNAEIERFVFKECKIEQVRFFQCIVKIQLVDCFIEKLFVDGGSNISEINIQGCTINNIIIEKNSSINLISVNEDTKIETFDSRDGSISVLKVNSSHIGFLRINKTIGDILLSNGGSLDRFAIEQDNSLKSFFDTLNNKRKSVSSKNSLTGKLAEARCQKAIILAALSEYEIEHRFYEADLCLIRLRSIDIAIKKLQSSNSVKIMLYTFEYFLIGIAFGWGVKIYNTIVTSCVVMLLFAVFYLYKMLNEWNIWKCIRISIGNFFNLNSTVLYPELLRVDLAEEIVGVIMLTILTGVIVRKIIR